jgi:hypothetical protein
MFLISSLQALPDVRTIQQHEPEDAMLNELKALLVRNGGTAVEDALGALALFALLFAGLALPGPV